MRKLFLITATVVLLLSCNLFAGGEGSGFGSLSTASTNGMGIGIFGVGAGFANANSIFGSFTYGMSANTDGRLRLALIDANSSNTELAFAADFKYNFVSVGELKNGPFDMALGGFFEYYNYHRPHQGIGQKIPKGFRTSGKGEIISNPILNGLIHTFERKAA